MKRDFWQPLPWLAALAVNGGLLGGMAWAGRQMPKPAPRLEMPVIPFDLVELPPKGVARDPHLLPVITGAAAPRADVAGALSEPQPSSQLEPKRRTPSAKRAKAKKRSARERARRTAAIDRILHDIRANEDEPVGQADGASSGKTQSTPTEAGYINLVSAALQGQLQVPSIIPVSDRVGLEAHVFFRVNAQGQVSQAVLARSSGNRFFDNAALSALTSFGSGGDLRVPLPGNAQARAYVVDQGITARMRAHRSDNIGVTR